MRRTPFLLAAVLAFASLEARAALYITEWSYSNDDGEFIELTNVGGPAIDLTGWSYSDNARSPGAVSLSSLGIVAPGESVLITEPAAAAFKASWGLGASVKVLGNNTANLGRSDEINIYNAASALVDRLTYNDQGGLGPRTQNASGNPSSLAVLGTNNAASWVLSTNGDNYGSYFSSPNSNIANPGKFALIPEPSGLLLAIAAVGGLAGRRRSGSR